MKYTQKSFVNYTNRIYIIKMGEGRRSIKY